MGIYTNYLDPYRATDIYKGMKIKKIKNYKMNDNVYKLRRQVIDLINEAKKGGVNLPWIAVRVGEQTAKHKNVLGCAKMSGNQMWITKDAIDLGTDTLRNIVFPSHDPMLLIFKKML